VLIGNEEIIANYPQQLPKGRLCDLAPTALQLMRDLNYEIEIPSEITGNILAISNSNTRLTQDYLQTKVNC
jgi:hypothetical protein